jgi:hypothetical protein
VEFINTVFIVVKFSNINGVYMKVVKLSFLICLIMGVSLFAQGQLPQNGIIGQWKFDDSANLGKATIGEDLIPDVISDAITPVFNTATGPQVGDGAVLVGSGVFTDAI